MIRTFFRAAAVPLVAALLAAGAGNGRAVQPAQGVKFLVPAYFYPGGAGMPHWEKLLQVGKDVEVVAIVNPASGPGKAAHPNYVKMFERMKKEGVLPIGYVSTSYAKRPLAEVQADVDQWFTLFPEIRGIFFDEQASAADKVEYYVAAAAHVRKKLPKALIVANPGTSCAPEYFTRPTADLICVLEQSKAAPEDQLGKIDPKVAGRCAVLLYDIKTKKEMQLAVAALLKHKIGSIFVTDGKLPNPWDRMPPWWYEQVKAVKQHNSAK